MSTTFLVYISILIATLILLVCSAIFLLIEEMKFRKQLREQDEEFVRELNRCHLEYKKKHEQTSHHTR